MATQAPENAGLTDEEIAAMAELDEQLADTDADDPLFNPDEVVKQTAGEQPGDEQEEREEEQDEEEQEALTPEEEQAKADQEAADKAKADEAAAAEAAKPEKPQQRDPILVAEAPEGAEARLTEIATAKGELAEKFDDGELTSKEYQAELDKLNKEERSLERAIDKAEIARDLENQRITNERMAEINTFLKAVDIPNDPKNLRFRLLDAAVRDVANDEANLNLSVSEVMQKAYDLCVAEGAFPSKKAADAPPAKDAPKPKAKTPIKAAPTLANIPAAEITSTEDNRFAYLNRISDPDRREAAFAKLSPADQEAYLATGG